MKTGNLKRKDRFMKRYMLRFMQATMIVVLSLLGSSVLTSCIVVNDPWDGDGGYVNNIYYDSYLTGVWQLYSVNGSPVGGTQTNWLQFNGNGRGYYFYFNYGNRMVMNMNYECMDGYNNYYGSNTILNLYYGNDLNPQSMYYWYEGNSLVMQWSDRYQTTTYVYRAVPNAPW